MMSKKHYIKLANLIKSTTTSVEIVEDIQDVTIAHNKLVINRASFINQLMEFLKEDNINFNYTTFKDAIQEEEV